MTTKLPHTDSSTVSSPSLSNSLVYNARAPVAQRLALAQNPDADAGLLQQLANDPRMQVREAVARHPKSDAVTLAALSDDHTPQVRAAVAGNPQLSTELLWMLAQDSDVRVVLQVVKNPRTSHKLLHDLASGEILAEKTDSISSYIDDYNTPLRTIRCAVLENPNVDLEDAIKFAEYTPRAFLANPAFQLWLLEKPELLSKLNNNALCNIARLTDSSELIRVLENMKDGYILKALLHNPYIVNVDADFYLRIFERSNTLRSNGKDLNYTAKAARIAAVKSGKLPVDLIVGIALNEQEDTNLRACAIGSSVLPEHYLLEFAKSPNELLAGAVANHPQCSTYLLSLLVKHDKISVRNVAARHPKLSLLDMETLLQEAQRGIHEENMLQSAFNLLAQLARNPSLTLPIATHLITTQHQLAKKRFAQSKHSYADNNIFYALLSNPAAQDSSFSSLWLLALREVLQPFSSNPYLAKNIMQRFVAISNQDAARLQACLVDLEEDLRKYRAETNKQLPKADLYRMSSYENTLSTSIDHIRSVLTSWNA